MVSCDYKNNWLYIKDEQSYFCHMKKDGANESVKNSMKDKNLY